MHRCSDINGRTPTAVWDLTYDQTWFWYSKIISNIIFSYFSLGSEINEWGKKDLICGWTFFCLVMYEYFQIFWSDICSGLVLLVICPRCSQLLITWLRLSLNHLFFIESPVATLVITLASVYGHTLWLSQFLVFLTSSWQQLCHDWNPVRPLKNNNNCSITCIKVVHMSNTFKHTDLYLLSLGNCGLLWLRDYGCFH